MYMMYPHYYTGGFFGSGILPFLIILGAIFLLWALFAHHDKDSDEQEDTALQILRERYAKGDITKRQFDQMKKDLE